MLAIDEEKLPPPTPATAATASSVAERDAGLEHERRQRRTARAGARR